MRTSEDEHVRNEHLRVGGKGCALTKLLSLTPPGPVMRFLRQMQGEGGVDKLDFKPLLKPSECKGRTEGAFTTRAAAGGRKLAADAGLCAEGQKQAAATAYKAARAVYAKHGAK
eukprot:9476859-Pyramimonas_sp.AAC.1